MLVGGTAKVKQWSGLAQSLTVAREVDELAELFSLSFGLEEGWVILGGFER